MIAETLKFLREALYLFITAFFFALILMASIYFSNLVITGDASLGLRLISAIRNPSVFADLFLEIWHEYNLLKEMPFGYLFSSIHEFISIVRASGYGFFSEFALFDAADSTIFYYGYALTLVNILIANVSTTYIGFIVFVLTFVVGDIIFSFITSTQRYRKAKETGGYTFAFTRMGRFIATFAIAISSVFISFALVSLLLTIFDYSLEAFHTLFFSNTIITTYNIVAPIILHLFLLFATIFFHKIIFNIKHPSNIKEAQSKAFWRDYQRSYLRQLVTFAAAYIFYISSSSTRFIVFIVWLVTIGYIYRTTIFKD